MNPPRTTEADPAASARLTRGQTVLFVLALVALVACSVWQTRQLRALQLQDKQALYAERLRTAQVILENELLAGAALTTVDARTRERATHYLQQSPR